MRWSDRRTWIVALILDVNRDWTWDGFQDPALTILRDTDPNPVGYLNVRQTVANSAVAQTPQRDSMRLIFFDARRVVLPGFRLG